jgi:hypothetical protein
MLVTLDSEKTPPAPRVAGPPATPPRHWTPVFPDSANITDLASLQDGWVVRTANRNYTCVLTPAKATLEAANAGIRARRRMPDSGHVVLLSVRHRPDAHSIELHYSMPNPENPECRLGIRENRMESLPPNASSEQRWAACVLLAEIQFPHPGSEVSCELIAVGKTVIGRLNGHTVTCTLADDPKPGGMFLRQAAVFPFRDFESIILDDLPESEALKLTHISTP